MKLSEKVMRKRCDALLTALLGKKMVLAWWNSKNKAFDGKTPEEHWKENSQSVYDYLMYHVSK
jgi:hypothetical protein